MFIGQFAVGFAAKKWAPRASLGALLAGALLADLLWPTFLLAGLEQVRIDAGSTAFMPLVFVRYPVSHSLVAGIAWATLAALLYQAVTRYGPEAVWIWIGVVSHWFLDALTHRPDMPLSPGGGTVVGLGLWNSLPATVAVEGTFFLASVWIYARLSRPSGRAGRYGFWAFVALLAALYAGSVLGPPPPDPRLLAFGNLATWLFIPWAWWFDRHRPISAHG